MNDPVPPVLCVHEMNRRGLCRRPAPDRSGWDDRPTREECDRLKSHPGHHAYRPVRLGTHPGPCSDGLPPDAPGYGGSA